MTKQREAFEKWASDIEPESGYKNGNVIFYKHQYKIWQASRQMVEYELMGRCKEEIDRPEFEVFMKKLGDKKILYFPKFPWSESL